MRHWQANAMVVPMPSSAVRSAGNVVDEFAAGMDGAARRRIDRVGRMRSAALPFVRCPIIDGMREKRSV